MKIWIIGVLVIAALISGCTEQQTTQQQTPAATPITTTASATPGVTTVQTIAAPTTTLTTSAAVVEIKGSAYNTATMTISKGTTVTWKQLDDTSHTVTSALGTYEPSHQVKVLDSPLLSKGQTYSYTFTQTGTFDYSCMIHPSMKGKVIVT